MATSKFTFLWLVAAILLVAGCGGETSDSDPGQTASGYVGNTDAAPVSAANAGELLSSLQSSYRSLGRLIGESLLDPSPGPRGDIYGIVAQRTQIDRVEPCASGSRHVFGTIEDDGSGRLNLHFQQCRQDDETLDGEVVMDVESFNFNLSAIVDMRLGFLALSYSDPSQTVLLSGSVRIHRNLASHAETLEIGNFLSRDSNSGHMFMLSDAVIVRIYDDLTAPTSFEQSISGYLFDSRQGFVEIFTHRPLGFASLDQLHPDFGDYEFRGAAGSAMRIQITNPPLILLALDADGNSLYETYFALPRDELPLVGQFVDSDADGMHDRYEIAQGYDPEDADDAQQDLDGDGADALSEYLAGTDPGDDASVPDDVDLEIEVVSTGDPVASARFEYVITLINRDSPGGKRVKKAKVTQRLPAGAYLIEVLAFSWDCDHAGRLLTCYYEDNSGFSSRSPRIEVDMLMPAAIGTIKSEFRAVSEYVDTNLDNNRFVHVVDLDSAATSERIHLDADAFDFELDRDRQRLYLSVPGRNAIDVVSLQDFSVIETIFVGSAPHGVSLSPDGSRLYTALHDGNAVAAVDLDDYSVERIDLGTQLGTDNTYDVIAPRPGEVYVTANRSGAKILKIDVANANQITPIAGGITINPTPEFTALPGQQFLYLYQSTRDVLKIDMDQPGAPVVLSGRPPGSQAPGSVDISPDGGTLVSSEGWLLDAETMVEIGRVDPGAARFSADGETLIVGAEANRIDFFDPDTLEREGFLYFNCGLDDIERIVEIDPGRQWILLGGPTLCRITTADPENPAPRLSDVGIFSRSEGLPYFGAAFDYILEVRNFGPVLAEGLVITFDILGGTQLNYLSSPGMICDTSSRHIECLIPELPVGPAPPLTVNLTLYNHGTIRFEASVETSTPDENESNNTTTLSTLVGNPANVDVIDFKSTMFDLEMDRQRNRFYVSLPERNIVAVVSLDSLNAVTYIQFESSPRGMALSPDGQLLHVALTPYDELAIVDLDTFASTSYPLNSVIGFTNTVYEVLSPRQGEVFISPDGIFFGSIAKVDYSNGVEVSRIIGPSALSGDVVLASHPDPDYLYVYHPSFSGNAISAIDLNHPDNPFVQTVEVDAYNPGYMAITEDGSILVSMAGEIFRTDTLTRLGKVGAGAKVLSEDESQVYVGEAPDRIGIYDLSSFENTETIYMDCPADRVNQIFMLQPDQQWLLLGSNKICRVTRP